MTTQSEEHNELYKCFRCDCVTYPHCSVLGELCSECFDRKHFKHLKPRSNFPGTFKPSKCDTNCEKTERYADSTTRFYVVRSPPNGDCLYCSISNALNSSNNGNTKITVEDLRILVSRKQTKETYDAYMALVKESPDSLNYKNMENVKSFAQFRHFIQRTGEKYGPNGCLWGDENAIQIIANIYGITFVIFNEKGNVLQKVYPSDSESLCKPRYILLRLYSKSEGEEHFDLLTFNQKSILTEAAWQYLLQKLA